MNPQMIQGLQMIYSPLTLLLMFGGVILGAIFGAIPGLSGSICIAIMLPVTYTMSAVPALAFLVGIYVGGIYGGSISAILFGTPGAPEASITVCDGYPMAKKGLGQKALNTALYASAVGNLLSSFIMISLSVLIARFALMIGAPEYSAILLFSLVLIATVGSMESVAKGLGSMFIGLFISFVGPDPINAAPRFDFGNINLTSSIPLIPVLIGVFVGGEILQHVAQPFATVKLSKEESREQNRITGKDIKRCIPTLLTGTVVGSIAGALPALNAAVAATLNYALTKKISKHPEEFGTGRIEGVAASECANNATVGPALVPLLTLGIPGTGTAAVLLGALMIQGIVPGPMIFQEHGDVVYAIFFALVTCTVLLLIGGKIVIQLAKYVLNVPKQLVYPVILMLCCIGSFCGNGRAFDILILLVCMLLGYLMSLSKVPILPLVIGYLLGGTLEKNIRQAMLMSQGSLQIFVDSSISKVFLIATAVLILYFTFSSIWKFFNKAKKRNTVKASA